MKNTAIYSCWGRTFEKANSDDLEQCFSIVTEHYDNPSRHYHNLKHVEHLIKQIAQLAIPQKDKALLINVAVFHDVIYKAGRKDNELKSAEFAGYWLSKLNVPRIEATIICDIIRATNTHQSSDFLTRLFLDMDLSILGVNHEDYQQYTLQIRKEHATIPTLFYKMGRKRFVKNMLSRKTIFATSGYYKAFENQARTNLSNELNVLNQ